MNEGRFRDAVPEINKLVAVEKCTTPETLFYHGFLLDKAEGDQKKALSSYKYALAQLKKMKDPSRDFIEGMVNFYASYISARLGQQDDSSSYLNSALAVFEKLEKSGQLDKGQGNYYLAYCYAKKGQEEISLEHYKAAIKYFEDNKLSWYLKAGAMFNIGLYYYNRAEYKDAQDWWQKAFDTEPDWGYFKNDYDRWLTTVKEKNISSGK